MSAYRDDLEAAQARIEALEVEKAYLERTVETMMVDAATRRIAEGFAEGYSNKAVERLEAENRALYQRCYALERNLPNSVTQALVLLPQAREEIARTRRQINWMVRVVLVLVAAVVFRGFM